jgi:hypothetical protein
MGIEIFRREPPSSPLCQSEQERKATMHVTWYEHYSTETAESIGHPGLFCVAAMPARFAASFVQRWRQLDEAGRKKLLETLWFYVTREDFDERYDPEHIEREWPDCRRPDFLDNADCHGMHTPSEIAAATAEHANCSIYLGDIPAE